MPNQDTDGNRMIWDETLRQWVPVTGSLSPAELANEINPILSSRFLSSSAPNQLWFPANQMMIHSGAPTLGTLRNDPHYLLDASSAEYVGGSLLIPAWWTTFNVRVRWANAGAGTGDVAQQIVYSFAGDGDNADTTTATATTAVVAAAPAQFVVEETLLNAAPIANVTNKIFRIRLGRAVADAADTLANDIYAFGLIFEQAS